SDDDFLFESPDDAPAPAKLSEFNAFTDLANQVPADDVIAYGLNTGHFADYARVRQFVRLPAGAQVPYNAEGVLDFPVGTEFFQTFSYPHDVRDPNSPERRIETRVMRKLAGGWDALAYMWSKDGTDARRSIAGGIVPVTWTDASGAEQSLKYIVMNKNDCKRCHENAGVMLAIGPTIANLNGDFAYASGVENQIAHWSKRGALAGAPATPNEAPRLARWDHTEDGDVEARARAWLHVNCAHCHNPLGAGGVSGLDLRLTQDSPIRIGIYKPPVAAGRGSEGNKYSIDPGKPNDSFLVGRLTSSDPAVMMPPIGRRVADAEAIVLVSEWIAGMHYDETEAQKLIERQKELFERVQREGKWPEDIAQ
ncbi:MAG: hypothetical protein FJY92_03650, partial [Candidatus Hydrogenedentes bacterium]|nr:hypothetical protein [Candidatus Hydrogenedentota bacterium]